MDGRKHPYGLKRSFHFRQHTNEWDEHSKENAFTFLQRVTAMFHVTIYCDFTSKGALTLYNKLLPIPAEQPVGSSRIVRNCRPAHQFQISQTSC